MDRGRGITLACVPCGCGSTAWSIPGAPRALPGHTLDPSKVLAVCLDCGATNTVANSFTFTQEEAT